MGPQLAMDAPTSGEVALPPRGSGASFGSHPSGGLPTRMSGGLPPRSSGGLPSRGSGGSGLASKLSGASLPKLPSLGGRGSQGFKPFQDEQPGP